MLFSAFSKSTNNRLPLTFQEPIVKTYPKSWDEMREEIREKAVDRCNLTMNEQQLNNEMFLTGSQILDVVYNPQNNAEETMHPDVIMTMQDKLALSPDEELSRLFNRDENMPYLHHSDLGANIDLDEKMGVNTSPDCF